jgi:hypothetical protein
MAIGAVSPETGTGGLFGDSDAGAIAWGPRRLASPCTYVVRLETGSLPPAIAPRSAPVDGLTGRRRTREQERLGRCSGQLLSETFDGVDRSRCWVAMTWMDGWTRPPLRDITRQRRSPDRRASHLIHESWALPKRDGWMHACTAGFPTFQTFNGRFMHAR